MVSAAEGGSLRLGYPEAYVSATRKWASETQEGAPRDTQAWIQARRGARIFKVAADPLRLVAGACAVGDALALAAPAALLSFGVSGKLEFRFETTSATVLGLVLTLELLRWSGAYRRAAKDRLAHQLARITAIWFTAFGILGLLWWAAAAADASLGVWLAVWSAGALLGLCLVRCAVALRVARWRSQGRLARIVAVVDVSGDGERLASEIAEQADARLIGVFPAVGDCVDALLEIAKTYRVDDIFVTGVGDSREFLESALRKLATIPADVHVCPTLPDGSFTGLEPRNVLGRPVVTVCRRPLCGWGRLVKRVEDVTLAAALLVVLAPVMLTVAAFIALDSPGPVLFRQKRLGFNNNEFELLKFRSMRHTQDEGADVPQARRSDPRVTRIGAYLRRTSLDELPQLVNVLRGEMSLVGPRPHAVPHNAHYSGLIDGYLGRHRILPGITGLAQVRGLRGETDTLDKMRRRVDCDIAYIDSWSFLLDIKILLKTVAVCLNGRNAY